MWNGTVEEWGDNFHGQCSVPPGLSNVVDVAAGLYHSLALLQNGTVAAWGEDAEGETNVPAGLSNVVAIAAGGIIYGSGYHAYSMALTSQGSLHVWGGDPAVALVDGLTNVIGISAGANYALALRTGPPTPVITLEPTDEYQVQEQKRNFHRQSSGPLRRHISVAN